MTPEIIALISGATIGLIGIVRGMVLPKDENSDAYQKRIRFIPVIGLVISTILTCILVKSYSGATIVQGIIFGLTAMGLYSATKTTAGK